ncbi:MAG TPA: hypothetical protein VGW38_04775, partial [Chloroflexota bacterium]|nr:hypothetical protein [Chloroflexota bacterium]
MALIAFRTKKIPPLIALISAYLPALILLAAVDAIQLIKGIPAGDFTRDVAAIAGVPFYAGAISTLGILFWGATASICFFTSAVLLALNAGAGPKKFAWWSGILTLILLIDDAFMIHENAPKLFGVSNSVILVIYGIVALYILTHR